MSLNLATLPDGRKAIIIRTSDRIGFKKCRRSWSWSSHLKENLGPSNMASPLWFGSAIHYALEDFHGHKSFDSAADAFRAYCLATSQQHLRDLPNDAAELYRLGTGMMDYYENMWLSERTFFPTYWHPDPKTGELVPQVEVNFEIEVPLADNPLLEDLARANNADCVLYRGTIDKVSIDEYGRLWVDEYKTAKVAEQNHYQTDPQVSTYVWAASFIYDKPVAGVTYQQFIKRLPEVPRILSSGKVSTASNLMTSAVLYKKQLRLLYGDEWKAPEENRKFLTGLMITEDENKDKYILREYLERTSIMTDAEALKILLELEDMLNPDLPMYPNPTRECSRMCSFLGACLAFDNGEDWEGILQSKFSKRDQAPDRMWRRRLPSPERMRAIRLESGDPDLESAQADIQAMSVEERQAIERGEEEVAFTFNM